MSDRPRPFTGEWMEIQYVRLQGRRRWKEMQKNLPKADRRKSVWRRYRDEIAGRKAWKESQNGSI